MGNFPFYPYYHYLACCTGLPRLGYALIHLKCLSYQPPQPPSSSFCASAPRRGLHQAGDDALGVFASIVLAFGLLGISQLTTRDTMLVLTLWIAESGFFGGDLTAFDTI
jgi:hypothetical protein